MKDRLVKKFGLGQSRDARLTLYCSLEMLAAGVDGEKVLRLISEVVAEAVSARRPANYFCFSIVRRLRENGFKVGRAGGDPSW